MASYRKRGRVWYYRLRDENRKPIEVKGCHTLPATKRIAEAAEDRIRQIRAGTLDPRSIAYQEAEKRPLGDHVQDWYAGMLAKGLTVQHVDDSCMRVRRMIQLMNADRISDLTPDRAERALAGLRLVPGRGGNDGLSDRSIHHHIRNFKAFSKWLHTAGRSQEDRLVNLKPPRVVTVSRRDALSHEQAARLIETAQASKESYCLTGEDRAALYRLALGTGFRANELRSLRPESFDLDATQPTVTVKAGYSKNRRESVQPIRHDLAEALRPWLATKPEGAPVFGLLSDTAKMIRRDLRAAGLPDHYDFHCLRHTFITMLVTSGANVKVCQTLARHSTPALTLGVYTHLQAFDLAQGLEGLAHILPTSQRELGRTGTDPGESVPVTDAENPTGKRGPGESGRAGTYSDINASGRFSKPSVTGSNPVGRSPDRSSA